MGRIFDRSALAALVALLFLEQGVSGGTIYQTGFEPPDYSLGQLAGQNGWYGSAFPVVDNTTVLTGSQSAEFVATTDTNPDRGQSIVFQPLNYNVAGNPDQIITVQEDFFVSAAGNPTRWEAIGLLSNEGFLVQVLVNLNGVALGLHGGAFLGGEPVTRGQWNHLQLDYDISNNFVSAYMNGELIASAFNPTPAFTSLSAYGWGINSDPGTDTAFIDNISLQHRSQNPPASPWQSSLG